MVGVYELTKKLSAQSTFRHINLELLNLHETSKEFISTFDNLILVIANSKIHTLDLTICQKFAGLKLNSVIDTLLTHPTLQIRRFHVIGDTENDQISSVIHSSEFDTVVRKVIQRANCQEVKVVGQFVESRMDTWWTPPEIEITPEALLGLPPAKPYSLERIELKMVNVAREVFIHVSPSDSVRFFRNLKVLILRDVIFMDDSMLVTLAESLVNVEELVLNSLNNTFKALITGSSVETVNWPRLIRLEFSGLEFLELDFLKLIARSCGSLRKWTLHRIRSLNKDTLIEVIAPIADQIELNVSDGTIQSSENQAVLEKYLIQNSNQLLREINSARENMGVQSDKTTN
ncbi:hypothetical protein HK096_000652 [Nowakowskiella sp. JEL0078]|nr:hypothetical protein HK096_000652 [Nowakowskiella sp. JEL0078]